MRTAYLTVPEVATELEMSPDGVYKLIKRGKLPAIRRSERGMRVSRAALEAYRRRLPHGQTPPASNPEPTLELDRAHAEFEHDTGLSAREWERRWRAEEIEDSAENMRLAIRALTLGLAERQRPPDRRSTPERPRKAVHAR
jgi:excisionase family DNA binding protein